MEHQPIRLYYETQPAYVRELESDHLVFAINRRLLKEILGNTQADTLSLQPQDRHSKEVLRQLLLQQLGK